MNTAPLLSSAPLRLLATEKPPNSLARAAAHEAPPEIKYRAYIDLSGLDSVLLIVFQCQDMILEVLIVRDAIFGKR